MVTALEEFYSESTVPYLAIALHERPVCEGMVSRRSRKLFPFCTPPLQRTTPKQLREASPLDLVPNRYEVAAPKPQTPKSNRKWYIVGGFVVLIATAIAVAVPLAIRSANSGGNGGSSSAAAATSGTSGSVITTEDGTTFTYINNFGGQWVSDPAAPFGKGGKAQSWSKGIGEEWTWGRDVIRGVNLG